MLRQLALVGLGGMIGAILRYAAGEAVSRAIDSRFPYGTLLINAAGCLAMGLLITLADDRGQLSANLRLFVIVGILGGFTTFSAFSHETFVLWRDGLPWRAALNIVASSAIGIAAVVCGHVLARQFPPSP